MDRIIYPDSGVELSSLKQMFVLEIYRFAHQKNIIKNLNTKRYIGSRTSVVKITWGLFFIAFLLLLLRPPPDYS